MDNSTKKLTRSQSYENYLEKVLERMNEPSKMRNKFISKDAFRFYQECDGYLMRYHHFEYETRGIYSLSYTKCGIYIVIGFGNGSVQILHKDTGKVSKILQGSLIGLPITSIKFNERCKGLFYASSENGTVTQLSQLNNTSEKIITESHNEIYTLEVDKASESLLTAGRDQVIRVYDSATAQLKSQLVGHENRIYCVRRSPDNKHILTSGGTDKNLKFWDLRAKNCCVSSQPSCLLLGDGIDIKQNLLAIVNWEEPPAEFWDFRAMKKIHDAIPYNRRVQKTGSMALCGKFFNADPAADVLLVGTMGHGSMALYSREENAVLHAFVTNETIVCLESNGNEIAFGGKRMGLYVAKFFLHGIPSEEND